ncbi:uncharacterized protein PODANS_1_21220 [Podospora anserina S mat+]|uniref:Podospora anserina S mat+ genomic DNA chromosome 1, supercontig 5 n=1 Tax=Podospora anserina (strain S / ATCC MYA-4624 / DSM 980 / FGSC 10383) TaxID=515849 RepID=B2ABL2_PODAN|nr:uncharacterized protein PODANS_1_21220 [Podospora anserina S mat+]CAP60853.1 unnamed protein product [Podospora anserina S mat+]CDP24517.1 Putative protein of unknown function [Podospora anserina S mat+]
MAHSSSDSRKHSKSGSSKSGSSRSGTGQPADYGAQDNGGYYLETFWNCHDCGAGTYTSSTTPQCLNMHCQHIACGFCPTRQEWVHRER